MIELLAAGASQTECAEKLGLHANTVWRRMQLSEFRQKVTDACNLLWWESRGLAVTASRKAVSVTEAIMDDESNPATVRLSAARLLMEHGGKTLDQTQVVEKIDQIEGGLESIKDTAAEQHTAAA